MKKKTRKLPLGLQMGLAFALVLGFLALTMALSLWKLRSVAEMTRATMQQPLAKERLISDWYRNVHTGVRRTQAIAVSTDSSVSDFFHAEEELAPRDSERLQKTIEPMLLSVREQRLYAEIMRHRQAYVAARATIMEAKAQGNLFAANNALNMDFLPAARAYLGAVEALQKEQRSAIDDTAQRIDAQYHDSLRMLLAVGMVALAAGIACATLIVRRLLRRLGGEPAEAAALAAQIATGNLGATVRLRAGDRSSLMHAMHGMQAQLAQLVQRVRISTEAVAAASGQIASGNLDLSARTESQAASLEQSAAALQNLTAAVGRTAAHAQRANASALAASGSAQEGGAMMAKAVETMGVINDAAGHIADIVGVIDGIAFQTNILALNAAVEAARAGEQGRGFAVVAAEVRSLARRSAESATEVKALIRDSVDKIASGKSLVDAAGVKVAGIVSEVEQVTGLIGDISTLSREQSLGIAQVSDAVSAMEGATQQNAALVEEAAAAAASLREQAGRLQEAVAGFTGLPEGVA